MQRDRIFSELVEEFDRYSMSYANVKAAMDRVPAKYRSSAEFVIDEVLDYGNSSFDILFDLLAT